MNLQRSCAQLRSTTRVRFDENPHFWQIRPEVGHPVSLFWLALRAIRRQKGGPYLCAELLCRGNVLFWFGGAFAEEEEIQLFHDDFLIFAASGVQAVFIEQHFAMLHPHLPGLLGDIFVDLLAEFVVERRLVETGELFVELYAMDHVRHKFLTL